jgi:hypothetical protein
MDESLIRPTHVCTYCGATVKDDDDICPFCFHSYSKEKGRAVPGLPAEQSPLPTSATPSNPPKYVTHEELTAALGSLSGGVLLVGGGLALSLLVGLSVMGGDVTLEDLRMASNLQIIGNLAVLGGVLMVFSGLRARQ